MSLSLLDQVVKHPTVYQTKSKSTHELNSEPAVVPRLVHQAFDLNKYSSFLRDTDVSLKLRQLNQHLKPCLGTDGRVLAVGSPHHLNALLDIAYGDANVVPDSSTVFPYLHGLSTLRQRVFFTENIEGDLTPEVLSSYSHRAHQKVALPEVDYVSMLTVDLAAPEAKPACTLTSSLTLEDLLLKNDEGLHLPFDSINDLRQSEELNNRNYAHQARLLAPLSHFIVYASDWGCSMHAARLVASLAKPHQFVYLVQFPVSQTLLIDTRFVASKVPEPYCCLLLQMEQKTIAETHSIRKLFPNISIGNLQDFHRLSTSASPFKLFINCHENAQLPDCKLLEDLFGTLKGRLHLDALYIDFPSSGCLTQNIGNHQIVSYLNVLRLIEYYARSHEVFIFCFDGFTGMSLLVMSLALIYYSPNTESALSQLLVETKLYFFKGDMAFLKRFEKYILWNTHTNQPGLNFLHQLHFRDIDLCQANVPPPPAGDWFKPNADNNFPARITDNLFLGSLMHASSKTILNLHRINHVISIGEQPAWLDQLNINLDDTMPVWTFNGGQGHVYHFEVDKSTAKHLGICHLRSIVYIHNIKDDGRDSLLPLLVDCPEHIQKMILVKPHTSTTTLLHCKIGVSRSASLVIASIMKHMHLDLLEAYMYVRIRRFNIIIQPNLRVFYELFLYEERLRTWPRKYCWAWLCTEIHKLNHYYISY